jgi:DNA primase
MSDDKTTLREKIQRARAKMTIDDQATEIGKDVTLRRMGREYRGPCPIHSGTKVTGFAVYDRVSNDHPRWTCHSDDCGDGDIFDYLMKVRGMSLPEAYEYVSGLTLGRREADIPSRQRERPAPPPVESLYRTAMLYHENLSRDVQSPESPLRGTKPSAWWASQGMSPATQSRFLLGYAKHCRTAYNPNNEPLARGRAFPSVTIPVFRGGNVIQIRHRLLSPIDPGDKYRPEVPQQGIHLFNADSLTVGPDGENRAAMGVHDALIVEGEKKCIWLCQLGLDSIIPIVSSTGGVRAWRGPYAEEWVPLFDTCERVFVLFDQELKSRNWAQAAASLFGRRGSVVYLPNKVDDLLMHETPDAALQYLISAIMASRPVRSLDQSLVLQMLERV